MAHELSIVNGKAQYASTQREWHGLGQLMVRGATIEEWQKQAGMDYRIQRSVIRYATARDISDVSEFRTIDGKHVLFRSDTGAALGVVSDSYKVVQPADVLEFFREWADQGGLTIESAGVLFGGARYFATAKLTDGVYLDEKKADKVVPYALLSTSADGSLATECRWTTVRTVCNNTLSLARRDKAVYKASHRTVFRPEEAKAAVEAAHAEFGAFMATARTLTHIKIDRERAEDMTAKLLMKSSEEVARASAGFNKIMALFDGDGHGATFDTARESAWGWLNAVTEYVDHNIRARSDENRQASALWGPGEALKTKALGMVETLAA